MSQQKRHSTIRLAKAEAACLLYGHQWETTIAPGLLACRRCYLTASCPVCIAIFPNSHSRLVVCSQHRVSSPEQAQGGTHA